MILASFRNSTENIIGSDILELILLKTTANLLITINERRLPKTEKTECSIDKKKMILKLNSKGNIKYENNGCLVVLMY